MKKIRVELSVCEEDVIDLLLPLLRRVNDRASVTGDSADTVVCENKNENKQNVKCDITYDDMLTAARTIGEQIGDKDIVKTAISKYGTNLSAVDPCDYANLLLDLDRLRSTDDIPF